jgi:hypothetical protein
MNRSTSKQLQALCDVINTRMGVDLDPWTQDVEGHYRANIGSVYIAGSLGRAALEQMVNEDGGVRVLLSASAKGDLADQMRAFLEGWGACEKKSNV